MWAATGIHPARDVVRHHRAAIAAQPGGETVLDELAPLGPHLQLHRRSYRPPDGAR